MRARAEAVVDRCFQKVPSGIHGPERSDSRGEDFLALRAQLALRPDVPVERHGIDPEFTAERGHGGVAVRHRGLGQPHLRFRQRERPAAVVSARP